LRLELLSSSMRAAKANVNTLRKRNKNLPKARDSATSRAPFLVIVGACDGGGVVQRCAFLIYLYVISNFVNKKREHTHNEQKVVSNVKKRQKKLWGDQSGDGNDNMVV
jgi:hypothetical protein